MFSLSETVDRELPQLSLQTGTLKLAKLSIEQSGPREEHYWTRPAVYPSPPMSGSPPPPRQRDSNGHEFSRPSLELAGQNVSRAAPSTQPEGSGPSRAPLLRTFQPEPRGPPVYPSSYGMEGPPASFPYPARPPPPPPPPELQQTTQGHYSPQYPQQLSMLVRPSAMEGSVFSPKTQRKTKGHVASACVPCKRAHLRCDAQRPCSRCLSNGKEDTCVDVQHKKRGRPRLRDERESRFEGMVPPYGPPPPDPGRGPPRRPMSMYSASDIPVSTPFESLQRSSSYRVLKSQGGSSMVPRHVEHASPSDATVYGGSVPLAPRMQTYDEKPCAYLTMNMQIAKATQKFSDHVGVQSIAGRKFIDIVGPADRDRVLRLERIFEEERRTKEPSYLPPIYLRYEEDRVIQSVGFDPAELMQFVLSHSEVLTFQGPDGQQRTFPVRLGLAKRDSTYFAVVLLDIPATPQTYPQVLSSPLSERYPRDSRAREPQYGFQHPQQSYAPGSMMPVFQASPTYGDPRLEQRTESMGYRGPPGPVMSPTAGAPTMGPPHFRQEQAHHSQAGYQVPASELRQTQSQPRQDLQLPPIRDPREEGATTESRGRRDSRDSRVDIGGLIEKPSPSRRA